MKDLIKKTLRLTVEQNNLLRERSSHLGFASESAYLIHLLGDTKGFAKIVDMQKELKEIKSNLDVVQSLIKSFEDDIISARKYAATAYLYALKTAGRSVEYMQSEVDRIKGEVQLEIKGRHT